MSPFSKTTLDINKLYVSSPIASKIPDEGEDKKDKAEDAVASKQGQSGDGRAFPFWTGCTNAAAGVTQSSPCGKKATTIQTRATTGTQRPRPPSRRPRRKTSNAKTPQVRHIVS